MTALLLTDEQLDALADRLADRLAVRLAGAGGSTVAASAESLVTPAGGLVDAQTLAQLLGTSREFVYRHRDEFGGERLGRSERGRLRFDPATALEAWTARCRSEASQARDRPPTVARASRRRRPSGRDVELLPIRGTIDGRMGCESAVSS